MSSYQIVFLFDINAYNDCCYKSKSELNDNLISLRLVCLRLLTHLSSKTSNFKWGFKFFDSNGCRTQTMNKFSFLGMSLENFETLENEISVRYQRHISYLEALAESVKKDERLSIHSDQSFINETKGQKSIPVHILHLALTQILCEFQWETLDLWSPSTKNNYKRKNILFFVNKCAMNEQDFSNYFGLSYSSVKSTKFKSVLLSHSLQTQMFDRMRIHWVWLNTTDYLLESASNSILNFTCGVLQSLGCSLMPVSIFSQSTYVSKAISKSSGNGFAEKELLESSVIHSYMHNSILPFSLLFDQSLSHSFYSSENTNMVSLSFAENGTKFDIVVKSISTQCKSKEEVLLDINLRNQMAAAKDISDTNSSVEASIRWSKFIIQFAVPKNYYETASGMLLCLPSVQCESFCIKNFKKFTETLFFNDVSLVANCETDCGFKMVGLLTPLTDLSFVMSILDPTFSSVEKRKIKFEFSSNDPVSQVDVIDIKTLMLKDIKAISEKKNCIGPSTSLKCKNFESECLENWYQPTSSVSTLISSLHIQRTRFSKIDAFNKKLLSSKSLKRRVKQKSGKESNELLTTGKSVASPPAQDNKETETYLSDEDLSAKLKGLYNTALSSDVSIMQSAKKIIKSASYFFQQKSIISYEEDMLNFMKTNFFTTIQKINEKYNAEQMEDSTAKIKECQMQVLLALEMEILIPTVDGSDCASTVTSFLRTISFYTGASEFNVFLFEVIKENYMHNLHHVVVLIGDQLDIPIIREDDSDESASSELIIDSELFGSVASTTASVNSTSSTSSRKGISTLIRHRSDIADSKKSRQILLPGTSPKKKKKVKSKQASSQKKPVRHSPRLASKKSKQLNAERERTARACRNLFPAGKVLQTPKKYKPSSNHDVKLRGSPRANHERKSFIAETPSHKQRRSQKSSNSDLQSPCSSKRQIKSSLNKNLLQDGNSTLEDSAADSVPKYSPVEIISPNAKDFKLDEMPPSTSNKGSTSLELLQTLHRRKSIPTKYGMVPSKTFDSGDQNFVHYTPESKRRLSLKLFSKVLTSPTARMGLKRCSKRLFDQMSPQPEREVKRQKQWDEDNNASQKS